MVRLTIRVDPPPSSFLVSVLWIFKNRLTYFDLFYYFIKGKQNFHIYLWSGWEGWHSFSPPLPPYSQPDHKIPVFLAAFPKWWVVSTKRSAVSGVLFPTCASDNRILSATLNWAQISPTIFTRHPIRGAFKSDFHGYQEFVYFEYWCPVSPACFSAR